MGFFIVVIVEVSFDDVELPILDVSIPIREIRVAGFWLAMLLSSLFPTISGLIFRLNERAVWDGSYFYNSLLVIIVGKIPFS